MTGVSTSCGACKFLRRKCTSECVFAAYFSYDEAAVHFSAVHKVFGASNFSRLLLRLPQQHRHEAAISVSYEALARMRDPVYGCVSYIYALQQEVANLQEEIEILGNHISMANLNKASLLPSDHSDQASNNFMNNNNNSSSHVSSLGWSPPVNLPEYGSTCTNQQQEQVVPAHAENNGVYYSSNNSITQMLPQPTPMCEWETQNDPQLSSMLLDCLLHQDIFHAHQWLVN